MTVAVAHREEQVVKQLVTGFFTCVVAARVIMLPCVTKRGRGGIGRRAGFRFQWDSREGSNPFARTIRPARGRTDLLSIKGLGTPTNCRCVHEEER